MPQCQTVFVKLLNEGTDVWRPVAAQHVGANIYALPRVEPELGEAWDFPPGATVRCETRPLSEGRSLVAVAIAPRFPDDLDSHHH